MLEKLKKINLCEKLFDIFDALFFVFGFLAYFIAAVAYTFVTDPDVDLFSGLVQQYSENITDAYLHFFVCVLFMLFPTVIRFIYRLGKKLVTVCQRGTNERKSGDAVLHQEP